MSKEQSIGEKQPINKRRRITVEKNEDCKLEDTAETSASALNGVVMWHDCTEEPPPDGAVIDVWQAWRIPDTGELRGRRLTNAWVYRGDILHGKEGDPVRCATHWMPVPKGPNAI